MTARDVIAGVTGIVRANVIMNRLTAAGCAIVPVEPTLAMRNAGNRAGFKANIHDVSLDVYTAMIITAQAEQEKMG